MSDTVSHRSMIDSVWYPSVHLSFISCKTAF